MRRANKCHLMVNTPTLEELRIIRKEFIEVKTLIEESHLYRRILKCNKCGQLYFYEFYETVDWEKGNDPQYTTYIPTTSEEEAEKLNKKEWFELLKVFPRLQSDFLQDGTRRIVWLYGFSK